MTIVAVTGATGSQGGGVVDALLSETKAKVRALTRNTSSSRAKALPAGVDVLEADLADKASLVKVPHLQPTVLGRPRYIDSPHGAA